MSLLQQAVNRVFFLFFFFFLSWTAFPVPVFSLTLQEEEVLGEEFEQYIKASRRLVRDPVIIAYVREVGGRIVDTLEDPPFPMTFGVVLDPSYNAFAGPGGHIYIHSGLILAMEEESELAGILGHETAHVTCRHISELVSRSKKIGIGTLAAMAAGILAGLAGASPDATLGLIAGSQAMGQSAMLAYTRENERQADERGLGYLSASGYGGEGLLRVLRKIRGQEWYTPDDIPIYLRTHPGTEERIAFVASWLETRQKTLAHGPKKDPSDNLRFRQMRNRLLGRYGDTDKALPQLRQALAETPEDLSLQHALALVLIRSGNREEALVRIEALARKNPLDPLVVTDLGRIRYLAGKPEMAIDLLEIMAPNAGDSEVYFDLGRTYAALGRYEEALKTYGIVMAMAPELIGAHYASGEAWGKMGNQGMSHYHLGRYHQARRDFINAQFHYVRSLSLLPEEASEREDAEKRLEEARKGMRREEAKKR